METIAQIIGVFALVSAVIAFQQKTHKNILIFQFTSDILFVLHFALLDAYTGAILNGIAALRGLVFVNRGKKWADNILWFWLFCFASVVSGIFTWSGMLSLLPVLGMILTTVAFWIKDPKLVRRVAFPSSPLWLVYNLANRAYGGVITEIINMISIIIAMIRLDFKKENTNQKVPTE